MIDLECEIRLKIGKRAGHPSAHRGLATEFHAEEPAQAIEIKARQRQIGLKISGLETSTSHGDRPFQPGLQRWTVKAVNPHQPVLR